MAAANQQMISIPTGPPNAANPRGTGPFQQVKVPQPIAGAPPAPQLGMPMPTQPVVAPQGVHTAPAPTGRSPQPSAGGIGGTSAPTAPRPPSRPQSKPPLSGPGFGGGKTAAMTLDQARAFVQAELLPKLAMALPSKALLPQNGPATASGPAANAQALLQQFAQRPIAAPQPPMPTKIPLGGPIGRMGVTGAPSKRLV